MSAKRRTNPRAGVPLASPYSRLITLDLRFAHRLQDWRANHVRLTQDALLEALEQHTDYKPDSKTTISRLELGKAWPNLEIVKALATLDATLDGGGGRGLLYWGWGLLEDPFRSRRPGAMLGVDGIPERELEQLEPPAQRRARRAR